MISLRRSAQLRSVDPAPPDWRVAFGNDAPIEVDLGCGRGSYAWQRALAHPEVNVVALDLRKKWIRLLRVRGQREGLRNFRAIRCDVSEDLPILFAAGTVSAFTVHHPDPWWKKRHRKRRMLKPELVEQMIRLLAPGGWIYVQTDVPDLAADMRACLESSPLLRAVDAGRHQLEHLGGLRSHRETKCLAKGIPVERMAYVLVPRGKASP